MEESLLLTLSFGEARRDDSFDLGRHVSHPFYDPSQPRPP
jgi:hypothetical protein